MSLSMLSDYSGCLACILNLIALHHMKLFSKMKFKIKRAFVERTELYVLYVPGLYSRSSSRAPFILIHRNLAYLLGAVACYWRLQVFPYKC